MPGVPPERRVLVQVREKVEGGTLKVNLSTLPEQKEYLRRIGNGNVSAGFRKVMGLVGTLCAHFDLIEEGFECVLQKHGPFDRAADFDDLVNAIKACCTSS